MERRIYPDDALRMSDAVTMHALAGSAGKWCVIELATGREFATRDAFDSSRAARAATGWNQDFFCYVHIAPDGMTPRAAEAFLKYARALHDAGFRLPSPDDEIQPDLTMPLLAKDRKRQIRLLTK